jgi:hypothetical protein
VLKCEDSRSGSWKGFSPGESLATVDDWWGRCQVGASVAEVERSGRPTTVMEASVDAGRPRKNEEARWDRPNTVN